MTWDTYYEKINDWAVSTAVSRISSLEDIGAPDEVIDAINLIALENENGATRLLNKALLLGIRFSGEDLTQLIGICSDESLRRAVEQSADRFTAQDLEALYGCVDDEWIAEAAKRCHLRPPEEIEDIVYEEPGDAEAYQDEILAAIESAGHALVCCTMAQEALCRSGNMSVLDLFSKRFMPSLMKHASLAEAEEYIQDAQEALECFNEDLRTILRNENVKLRHARLCSAIDLWFDSGVMDWFVHLQINRMRRRIGKVIAQVQSIQEELKRLYTA